MVWVFGYGSLVWRPAFAFERAVDAWIEGYERRFWQGSTDHRGTETSPGRVVTLVAQAGARCAGRAFEISDANAEAVLAALDVREQGGYDRLLLPLLDRDGRRFADGLVYLATEKNKNWLGEASLEAIAAQVRLSAGPSGKNVEYVTRLADALRAMRAEDAHVFALARLVDDRVSGSVEVASEQRRPTWVA